MSGSSTTEQLAIGRDDHHVELVDLGELFGLGVGRAGHAGQLLVLAEVVLEGDGRERLVLALDLDLLLRFDGLVQPVAPPSPRHQAARELVDDDDLAVLDHVIHVEAVERVGTQRLIDVVEQRHVGRVVQPARLQPVREHLLGPGHPAFGERDGLVLLVLDEVPGGFEPIAVLALGVAPRHRARLELRDDAVHLVVQVGGFLGRSRNDERRPGLVDEDAVDLVHDREMVPALDEVREVELHVVAQVVEAELVVGPVRDVAAVGDLAFLVVEIVLDDADRHAEEAEDLAHPLRVAPRQVVVDGDDVNALAGQRVEVGRQRRDQRLAFARLHLGDAPGVEHVAADELHVEVPHVERTTAGLAHDGKRLGQQVVERGAAGKPLAELGGLLPELAVGEARNRRLEGVDGLDNRTDLLQLTLVLRAEDLG